MGDNTEATSASFIESMVVTCCNKLDTNPCSLTEELGQSLNLFSEQNKVFLLIRWQYNLCHLVGFDNFG